MEKEKFGCPIGCKYCMVTHINCRREKWEKIHRYGINKTVLFVNKLEGEMPLSKMNLDTSFFEGEYVGFEGITDAFNPIFEDDLKYMIYLSKNMNMKKLVLVTKWPISKERLKLLTENKKILLVISITGLDMLENVTTKQKLNVLDNAYKLGIDVLPIIHPYIHSVSDISFLSDIKKIGIKNIAYKGLRYNDEFMGSWARKYMSDEIYKIYKNSTEDEILLGEEYLKGKIKENGLNVVNFREYVQKDGDEYSISYDRAKKIVDKIFKEIVVSSSDTNDAVYKSAIMRRIK